MEYLTDKYLTDKNKYNIYIEIKINESLIQI